MVMKLKNTRHLPEGRHCNDGHTINARIYSLGKEERNGVAGVSSGGQPLSSRHFL